MQKAFFISFLFFIPIKIYASPTFGDTLKGKVIKIVDGDTFDLLTEEMITIRIRMNGIDCPETKQTHFKLCKEALGNLIFLKKVSVIVYKKDRWRRSIADVYLGKRNINYEMVRNGFAWHFIKYSNDAKLAQAEKTARKLKKGLWITADPLPPWKFRKPLKKNVLPKKI